MTVGVVEVKELVGRWGGGGEHRGLVGCMPSAGGEGALFLFYNYTP